MRIKLLISIFLFISLKGFSQENTGVFRGSIKDAVNGSVIPFVRITLNGPSVYALYSDSSGYFSQDIVAGTYRILLQSNGYGNLLKSPVVILSGKQYVLDLTMEKLKVELDSVIITSNSTEKEITLDQWNIQKSAAVFYDPARMVTSYAGIINTDDQANNISVHGTSPNYTQWKLEGVEVVNPNHLENAGTINDRPAFNGGGVSLLSAQILQSSSFKLSPFEAGSGNTLSGIFDMKLRAGNNQKYERIFQFSLLGTDLCIEGPLFKKSEATFLVNYRYSTVGLLSKLGINFGGDQINYQDLSVVLYIPFKNGSLKLFSISGNSETIFRGGKDSSLYLSEKDLKNIDYHSYTSINGLNFIKSINNNLLWRSVISYSIKEIQRESEPTGYYWLNPPEEKDEYGQQKISTLNYLSRRFGNSFRFKAGLHANYFRNLLNSSLNEVSQSNGKVEDWLLMPFIALEGTFLRRIDYKLGMHFFFQPKINEKQAEPRCMVTFKISDRNCLIFNYGSSSQLQPFSLYIMNSSNSTLRPTLSHSFSLAHLLTFKGIEVKNEVFYQYYYHIPVNKMYNFSAFNYFNEIVSIELESSGTAKTYGYDLTIEKHFMRFYFIFGSSLFDSRYSVGTIEKSSRFNTGYNFSITGGKEYTLRDRNKMISTDFRWFIRDGFKERTNTDYIYNSRIQEYYRIDLRISYRRDKKRSSVIWALDLQNATNRKNEAYHSFDTYTHQTETHYQLGIIPVLSYKILF
jgi:hypothetical protein